MVIRVDPNTNGLDFVRQGWHYPFMKVKLSPDGHVAIPVEIQTALGLQPGVVFCCSIVGGRIILDPDPIRNAASIDQKSAKPVLIAPPEAPAECRAEQLVSHVAFSRGHH